MFHTTSSCVASAKRIVYCDFCAAIRAQPWQGTLKLEGYSAANHMVDTCCVVVLARREADGTFPCAEFNDLLYLCYS